MMMTMIYNNEEEDDDDRIQNKNYNQTKIKSWLHVNNYQAACIAIIIITITCL